MIMPEALDTSSTRSKHRSIVERVDIKGTLVLNTPASFGNGDADAFTDIPLLRDERDNTPLLTGTSIAGALRNYLREREFGYGRLPKNERASLHVKLFGDSSEDGTDDEGPQSRLIVHDAPGCSEYLELRDGVKIDGKTRTAQDEKKFDFELLAAGTTFELRFELLVSEQDNANELLQALGATLDGLATHENGLPKSEITMGARKRRGFGGCSVPEWEVARYNLRDRAQYLAWLIAGRTTPADKWVEPFKPTKSRSIFAALGVQPLEKEERRSFQVNAEFSIDGSILIRSGFGEADSGADMVHLHSRRDGGRIPVIPGTSWTGAIRSRATQIANTLASDSIKVEAFIESIFGDDIEKKKKEQRVGKAKRKPVRASRVEISESTITNGIVLRQSRVKIDRFTGGAFESALFDEEPLFGTDDTRVSLDLRLRLSDDCEEIREQAEVGLLLLVLKDLWTGDLPLGGEVGNGRGRLKGRRADLVWRDTPWVLTRNENATLKVEGDKERLERCVKAMKEALNA